MDCSKSDGEDTGKSGSGPTTSAQVGTNVRNALTAGLMLSSAVRKRVRYRLLKRQIFAPISVKISLNMKSTP